MLKESSSFDGVRASSISRSAVGPNNFSGGSSSPHYNCNPFLSPSSPRQLDLTDYSTNYYSSLFVHNCKSPSDTSFDDAEAMATERRLFHASFVLEYQQLYNRYTLCLAHLQESLKEVNALRQENESIRLANADLVQRLSLLSQATIQNCLLSDFSHLGIGVRASPIRDTLTTESKPPNVRPPPGAIEQHRLERRNQEQVPIPKSISVRSSGYLKMKAQDGSAGGQSSHRLNTQPLGRSQRVYVPGVKRDEEALEFDVYNQGMLKTELCNKWQETGECPYGENCQFAHGIKELRPVIRHPRYKTEVCRMVLAGDNCPYGHRCHFRHSITDQDRPSSNHLR
ncbi:PREDICTED: zinc finger CCCH domain-containing protein 14-like isoform X2 [Ipomoea nil]|uniref:zinc finger CCCH domain-containing protein 14-like isoform X2 n=1 Tax=Ipomoea nil TaxID=35883 RepID=UPI0009017BC0|nr:PREDICTED: zinc finger CCCH domain-containing protein 14-like isoform X2 [Ipomoea nil]